MMMNHLSLLIKYDNPDEVYVNFGAHIVYLICFNVGGKD